MKKRTLIGKTLRLGKGILLVLCVLLLFGTLMDQLHAQLSVRHDLITQGASSSFVSIDLGITWKNQTTFTVTGSSSSYAFNVTIYGIYNGTYFNLYCPVNYLGSLPLVIQYGGYSGIDNGTANLNDNEPLCGYLASRGYAVLEFGYPCGGTIPQASQTCLEILEGTILPWVENGPFPLTIDKLKIALCGHSAGGAATLGLASSKVASSVALAPYYLSTSLVPEVRNIAPTLILTGQNDTLVPYYNNGTAYYDGLVASKTILDVAGAGHSLGVGASEFPAGGTGTTLKYVSAWFDATLKANSTAASLFTSSSLSGDSGVDKYQVDITTHIRSPSPSESGDSGAAKSDYNAALSYGLIIGVGVSIVVGFTVYQARKQRQKALAADSQKLSMANSRGRGEGSK